VVNTDPSWGGGSPGVYRTTNGGTTWTRVSTQGPFGAPLVTSNGTIYWPYGNSLLKSTDSGSTWVQVGSGLQTIRPIELVDGRLVALGSNTLVISADGGSTWSSIGSNLPYNPSGSSPFTYSATRKAFFISHFDCGGVVLSDAIMKLDYDFGGGTSTPIVGDINLDHIVNSIDYSILNSKWFTSDANSDLNHDGLVNAIDFSILNSNWFKTW
jgi:hypothetical protein